jgi:WD40 repeat protein
VPLGAADPLAGKGWVSEVCYCSDGRRLAFYQEETVVRLWDLDKQQEQSSFQVVNQAMFPTAALRADGKLAAVGDGNGILTLWYPETGRKVALQASRRHIPHPSFSPDGRTMATHDILESAVKIWDMATLVGKEK